MKYVTLTLSLILISTISLYCKNPKDFDFLNPKYKTSALMLTDGEKNMLPCFSGENETDLYTVYFLGRTEEERIFWDVIKMVFGREKTASRHIYMQRI